MKEKQTLQRLCRQSNLYLKHHSPDILTCIGALGVIATAVMAVKATPKALKRLEKAMSEKEEALTKLEQLQVVVPLYIPAAIIGVATISCVLGANMLNKHNQASLASAYAMLDQSYKRYRKAATTVYGEDADSNIKIAVAREIYISADGYAVHDPEMDQTSEKVLFYDQYSGRYFTSTMASVLNAEYHVNRNFTLRGDVTLNEFYGFLGIDKIDCGDEVGWSMDDLMEYAGMMWLDFENKHTRMEDGMECYIVSTLYDPTILYNDIPIQSNCLLA